MKTEVLLADALKELMSKESLDEITVKRLSDMCGIKRQTFYYHFRDIYDLLTWIFLNEDIKTRSPVTNWQDAVRVITKYVNKNKKFIKNTVSSAGRELFQQFVASYLYSFSLRKFVSIDKTNIVPSDDRRFYVNYFVSGITNSIMMWIDSGMKENEDKLIAHLDIVVKGFLDDVVINYKKK